VALEQLPDNVGIVEKLGERVPRDLVLPRRERNPVHSGDNNYDDNKKAASEIALVYYKNVRRCSAQKLTLTRRRVGALPPSERVMKAQASITASSPVASIQTGREPRTRREEKQRAAAPLHYSGHRPMSTQGLGRFPHRRQEDHRRARDALGYASCALVTTTNHGISMAAKFT